MRLTTTMLAIATLGASVASANALPPVRAGILQCQGGQNVGFVVGSVTSFECVFQSAGRRPEPYIATVRRYGLEPIQGDIERGWRAIQLDEVFGFGEIGVIAGIVGPCCWLFGGSDRCSVPEPR